MHICCDIASNLAGCACCNALGANRCTSSAVLLQYWAIERNSILLPLVYRLKLARPIARKKVVTCEHVHALEDGPQLCHPILGNVHQAAYYT